MSQYTTITAKVDALRAKGFTDSDIDDLLGGVAVSEPNGPPMHLGEIFDNGAPAEEWNKQVDETEQLYIYQNSYLFFALGLVLIAMILGMKGYLDFFTVWYFGVINVSVTFLVLTCFMPKWREKAKFFVKKRQ
ncbi:hypothetical protein [Photobacterium leiognathi]|uniref:Uncharacterized protein n=1 Tax=Photobacterium leiognathi TaxID=553611 RepID=A0A2T3M7X1_PHOLE|nr:hypothetical protein [Photobacterium leiognathi]KJF97439.1 hypothetical protein UB34_13065 [Photobacterium leiognathi]PSV88246.1 hypothetical protein CTM89_14815 [Photobacterium leiognathi]